MSSVSESRGTAGRGACLVAVNEFEQQYFLPPDLMDRLRSICPTLHVIPSNTFKSADWPEMIRRHNVEVIVGGWSTPGLPPSLPLDELPLRCYTFLAGGLRGATPRPLIEKGLRVSNWGDSISRTIAEGALMLILMSLRRATHWQLELHRPEPTWRESAEWPASLFERRVGIHGFGNIARRLTELLRPFNAKVSAYDPPVPDSLFNEFSVSRSPSLEHLFGNNDVIVELAALTPETEGIVNERLLRMIPEGGVFVNVGRGKVVDEAGLARVLAEGRIRVGLDVFVEEPLPANSPLRQMPDATLMPHTSGPTLDRMRDSGARSVENISRYYAGQPLIQEINLETYDRIT